MGSHRAVPSTTSDIGGVRTEGETTPITSNVKTFTSHLHIKMILVGIKTKMVLMMKATMMIDDDNDNATPANYGKKTSSSWFPPDKG